MPRKSRKNVGVIGLGIIGSRVAAALRANGFHVYVWSRSPRVVPNFLASPAEVAEVCETIQIFVSDAQALFEVIEGFDDQLSERHTVLCNATIGPEATLEAAKLVEEKGAQFLDAPFTGSKAAADKRELVYYIGGSDETLKKVQPVLQASSKLVLKIGAVGQAATMKIATNMIAAVTVQTLGEALAIVRRSGIAPEMLMEALDPHGVRSNLSEMKLPKMIQGDFEPHFAMKHMFKDVQLAIHVANSLDIDIPATTATAGVMYGGLNRGWADLDFSALAKIYAAEDEVGEEPATAETAAEGEKPAAAEKVETKRDAQEPGEETNQEEGKVGEPPKETLVHMMPPPPREELAASLKHAKDEGAILDHPPAATSSGEGDSPAALGQTVAEERKPDPAGDDRIVVPDASTAPEHAKETSKPVTASADLAKDGSALAGGDAPKGTDNARSDVTKGKPVPPRLNPIRRWFVARAQNLRQ